MFSQISAATSYDEIRSQLQAAVDDPSIKSIVLDIDSPGGEVHGCGELSKAIFEARSVKPIMAYASGTCASAAYWIGSAAHELVVDPSAIVGSIGVRTLLVDQSEADKAAGLKKYDIVSSQSPNKVVDASDSADRARVKANLTAMASVFINDVARNRAVSDDRVVAKFGQGDVFIGADAVSAGLADRIGSLDEIISELAGSQRKETNMAKMPLKGGIAANVAAHNRAVAAKDEDEDEDDDMNCDACDKAMSSGSKTYCSACYGGKANAEFITEVLGLTGVSDPAKALGVLLGLKAQADLAVKYQAELELVRKAKAEAEISGLIEAAVKDGRATPAKKAELEGIAARYGAEALKSMLAIVSPASEPALEPTKSVAESATHGLTKDQLKILKATGITPEAFVEHKKKLKAQTPQEEN